MPLQLVRNDIVNMRCDAVVAPTDSRFSGGGGADAAIHRAAGPALARACKELGGCRPGEARATEGFNFPCRYIFHTVGPRWYHGRRREREILASCYRECLKLAAEKGCQSVAFPLIASGTFGFPKGEALTIAAREITAFLTDHDIAVFLAVYDKESFALGKSLQNDIAEYIDERYVAAHDCGPTEAAAPPPPAMQAAPYQAAPRQELSSLFESAPRRKKPSRPFSVGPNLPEAQKTEETPAAGACLESAAQLNAPELEQALSQLDESFSEMLLRLIDEKGMTDAQCYKKANIDRKLFSKIRSNPQYKPSKPTAIAFAVALELSPEETGDLLRKAGYALSHSSKFDIIVEYFLQKGKYDIFEINEALFAFDQVLLGM